MKSNRELIDFFGPPADVADDDDDENDEDEEEENNEEEEEILYSKLIKINGVGSITADRVVFNLEVFSKWLEKHPQVTIKKGITEIIEDDRFSDIRGKNIVFTGFTDFKVNDSGFSQLKDLLINNGVIVKKNYVKTAYYLIVKDITKAHNKIKKAKEDNLKEDKLKIIELADFIEKYKIQI